MVATRAATILGPCLGWVRLCGPPFAYQSFEQKPGYGGDVVVPPEIGAVQSSQPTGLRTYSVGDSLDAQICDGQLP